MSKKDLHAKKGEVAYVTPNRPECKNAVDKETLLGIIGWPLHNQLRVEAMWGYVLCGGNQAVMERSQAFFNNTDKGRAGVSANPL